MGWRFALCVVFLLLTTNVMRLYKPGHDAVTNPQTPQWARHSGTPGTHNTLASGSHHSAHSSHMVQAYAAANVQACGTISGAPGAVDNRERRDLLDLEQQEEEEDVQQDEQQRDERQEEQRDEQQVEQQSRAGCERRAAGVERPAERQGCR